MTTRFPLNNSKYHTLFMCKNKDTIQHNDHHHLKHFFYYNISYKTMLYIHIHISSSNNNSNNAFVKSRFCNSKTFLTEQLNFSISLPSLHHHPSVPCDIHSLSLGLLSTLLARASASSSRRTVRAYPSSHASNRRTYIYMSLCCVCVCCTSALQW